MTCMKPLVAAWLLLVVWATSLLAGGAPINAGPPLDYTLMAMKEQGVWYFLCEAPEYHKRIPPHFATYGPPPPPYCGLPCGPVGPVPIRK